MSDLQKAVIDQNSRSLSSREKGKIRCGMTDTYHAHGCRYLMRFVKSAYAATLTGLSLPRDYIVPFICHNFSFQWVSTTYFKTDITAECH